MQTATTHMSNPARTCPACHQPLPADAPQGLCPQCLAKSALGSQPGGEETVASGSKPGGSGPATIQPEIARLFPQLEIMEPLGQGGMGMVYKARQPQLDRVVALKVMRADLSRDPAFAERFAREARALAKLNHPNIVSVFDFGQSGGHCWILMEFVDGTNLRELLRTKTLQPREALGIVPKVCDALQYAHDEGIVHRDIKPENILLDKKGRVKIADFGLAKLVGKDASEFSLTATGMTLGTPRYMAPEQFDKPQEVDHRADIYSLGVVLYEMLTGEVPMGRFSLPSATVGVDVRLDEIVLRTLEKEPSRRYQHASEVKTQVENVTGIVANQPRVPTATQTPGAAEPASGAKLLLDETDRSARQFQHLFFISGLIWIVLGLVVALIFSGKLPIAAAMWAGGIAMLIMASRHRQQWEVDYLGHVIRFENGIYTSGRLMVDGNVVASGGVGFHAEISGRIPRGSGAGQRIVARTNAEFRFFRCQLFAEPNASTSATEIRPGNEHLVATSSPRPLLSTALVLLCLFGFFFGFSFQAKHSAGATGQTKLITIGALDPLFVSQSGPAGFSTNLNFFSWSFLALVVSGVALGALWRIGREDQGKVPRDPAWWRNWWKQVGLWGGLLFIVCTIRAAMHPEKVLQPPGDRTVAASFAKLFSSGPEVRADRSQLPVTTTPGRRDFAFSFNAPPNHVLNVWLEFWKDGKVKRVPEFAWGYAPVRGDAIRAGLLLTTQDGDMAGVGSAGQMRFDWALATNVRGESLRSKGTASYGHWRTNVFKEIASRGSSTSQLSWDVASAPGAWRPKPGAVATVLAWTAHAGKSVSSTDLNWTEESLRQGVPAVAILLRVRFDPVSPEQLRDSPTTSTSIINVKDLGPVSKPPAPPPQTNDPQATTTAPPAALASDMRFNIQQDRSQLPVTATPGRQDYAFKFSGPKDHTLNVWMEVWQEGKMEWVSDFDFEARPKAGEPLAASLKLTTMDGDKASVESKGKTRFDWTMLCGGTNGTGSTSGAWRTNIHKPMGATYSTWDRPAKTLSPRPGETVTVLGITGYELSNFRSVMPGFTETDLLKRWPNAAVLIRARFSPARPGQLSDGVGLGVNVSDKAFEKRSFAQFEIGKQLGVDLSACRTPVEAHAALVAAASAPDGRARAAQMIDELGSDNISYVDQFRFAAEPMLTMWWKLRKKEPATAEEVVGLLENFITAVNGPGSHGVRWNHGEPIIKWAEGPLLKDDFAKKLKLTKLQVDEVNKLFKKYADEANALRRRHTKVTKNDQGHVLINIEPYSEECLELARKMVAELGGIVTQDIVPAVKVGALPMAIFGNAGECRETVVLKKDSDGVYVIRIITSDWVPAGRWRGDNTTGWGSKDIDFAFGSYKMYWTEE